MKYKNYLLAIDEAIKTYKGTVDAIGRDYVRQQGAVNAELEKIRDNLTEKGITEYLAQRMPKKELYARQIEPARERARTIIGYNFERLEGQLDYFFAEPPGSSFVEHITAICTSGLSNMLTNREFEKLKLDARNYSELRLLQALGAQRTRKQTSVVLTDPDTGNAERRETEVPNPFHLDIPDPDKIYGDLRSFKTSANAVIRFYSGEGAELADVVDQQTPNGNPGDAILYRGLSTAYFRKQDNPLERITASFDQLDAVLPKRKLKTELTESDKRLINAIVPPDEFAAHPYLYREQIRHMCAEDEGLMAIFSLDERYKAIAAEARQDRKER